jgi:4'-phosphopantetheinyl transferase EntD
MISAILPPGVVVVETLGDISSPVLFAQEESVIRTAGDKRRREFTLGRHCARRALSSLGVSPQPILSGGHREPLWPAEVVGSITHCDGYCAAAVALRQRVLAIGIDAEVHSPLPEGVLAGVALDKEREWLSDHSNGETHWDRVLFSAKESVYKVWFPMTGRWLEFKDAMVTIDPISQTFVARLLISGLKIDGEAIHELAGGFRVAKGFIVTAISLEASRV